MAILITSRLYAALYHLKHLKLYLYCLDCYRQTEQSIHLPALAIVALETVLAFCVFALVTSITPGPNNLMLLASGMNFGTRASIPHILGISSGFFVMLVAVGLGLGALFVHYPIAYTVIKALGAAYLVYLAWRIATADSPGKEDIDQPSRPMSWTEAALFQWVNPKAWVMAIGAFSTYVPPAKAIILTLALSALFAVINAPSVAVWAVLGSSLRRLLDTSIYRRWLNMCAALLLVLSLVPVFWNF